MPKKGETSTELLKKADKSEKTPEEDASFFSKIFLTWVTPLIQKGSADILNFSHLYNIPEHCLSQNLCAEWKAKRKPVEQGNVYFSSVCDMFNFHRRGWIAIIIFRFIVDILHFIQPLLVGLLLNYVESADKSLTYGIGIALSIFIVSEIRSFCIRFFLYKVVVYSVEVHSILVNLVHEKVLLALGLLWKTIGPSAVGGIIFMILLIPINFYASRTIKRAQAKKMKATDKRIQTFDELLTRSEVILSNGWSDIWKGKINKLRTKEVKKQEKTMLMARALDALNMAAPFFVALITYATYVLSSEDNILTAEKAFVSLVLFNHIRQPMRMVANYLSLMIQASVSLKRLTAFFDTTEETNTPVTNSAAIPKTFLDESNGKLICITGPTGSGKSRFLSQLAENVCPESDCVSYITQEPWVPAMTIKEFITLGDKFDDDRYKKTLQCCELDDDINNLQLRENTSMGDRKIKKQKKQTRFEGCQLSGGQRARIALAQAVYRQADTYFIDDIFCSLDVKIGKRVFEQVLHPDGILGKKRRILVTNDPIIAQQADSIILINDGKVEFHGLHSEYIPRKEVTVKEQTSLKTNHKKNSKDVKYVPVKKLKNESTKDKKIPPSLYWIYINSATVKLVSGFVLFLILHHFLIATRGVLLSKWSDDSTQFTPENFNSSLIGDSSVRRLQGYSLTGALETLSLCLALFLLVLLSKTAALRIHKRFLHFILACQLSWFSGSKPSDIRNRTSKDFNSVDGQLPQSLRQAMQCFIQIALSFSIITYTTPYFILPAIPLVYAYYKIQKLFIPSCSQLKRIESIYWSPVLENLTETINGYPTLWYSGLLEIMKARFERTVDDFIKCKYLDNPLRRWLALRLDLLGNLLVFLVCVGCIIYTMHSNLTSGFTGLAITFALLVNDQLSQMVRMVADAETHIIALERINEYSCQDSEEKAKDQTENISHCPEKLEWKKCTMKYREGSAILNNLSLFIPRGQKVAIVGRTGSGKSSILRSLIRACDVVDGELLINDFDIRKLSQDTISSVIAFLPQECALFSGSLRYNIDPTGAIADDKLWEAVDICELTEFVKSMPEGLDSDLTEKSTEISSGTRQLLCLCRTVIRQRPVVLLDEMTSSVDLHTSSTIHSKIHTLFPFATVLSVLHNLDVVKFYDRVIVIENGEITEDCEPKNLINGGNNQNGKTN